MLGASSLTRFRHQVVCFNFYVSNLLINVARIKIKGLPPSKQEQYQDHIFFEAFESHQSEFDIDNLSMIVNNLEK